MKPGPLLAIDYGRKRCGLARSDRHRILATGFETFEQKTGRSFREHLRSLFASGGYAGVVLGFPFSDREDDGEDGAGWRSYRPPEDAMRSGDAERQTVRAATLADEILLLARWIERELGSPVYFWDESLTSREAEARLRAAKRSDRRDKAAVDRLAAEILLQEFLDAGCPEQVGPQRPLPGGGPPEEPPPGGAARGTGS